MSEVWFITGAGRGMGTDIAKALNDHLHKTIYTLQGFASPVSIHPISYAGLNAEKLSVIFTAPSVPAIYRVAYYPFGYNEPAGRDELFVQET